MAERIFAVVDVAAVSGIVNPTGAAIVATARHSLDRSKIILDFNHHRATIDGLFNSGVDLDAVVAACEMLTHEEALTLMSTDDWYDPANESHGAVE